MPVVGNPGTITVFKDFCARLHQELNLPVVTFSHFGHIRSDIDCIPFDVVTVENQIDHKVSLIQQLIPGNVEIFLIGHSVGGYMAFKMMKKLKESHAILHNFLIMATLERLGETYNAVWAARLFKLKHIWTAIAYVTSQLVPDSVARFILRQTLGRTADVPSGVEGTLALHHWKVVWNCIALAEDEFKIIKERDDALLKENLHKMTMVYGYEDNWAPYSYYENLKSLYPEGDIVYEARARHTFFFKQFASEAISDIIIKRVQQKDRNENQLG